MSHASEEAKVSVYDRGFLYGDSVFETIRSYGGKLYQLERHMQRLEQSARCMEIAMPVSRQELAEETARAVAEADNSDSVARVMLTRGSGPVGLDPALASTPLRVILVEPLVMPSAEQYRMGLSAICVETVRASDVAPSAKLGNYLASALALAEAKKRGADEALVVNRDGLVVEATTSNVFAVMAGSVLTPPLESGVLEGITRSQVLDIAKEIGVEVQLVALRPEEIAEADEIFLSSSVRELMPIVRLDESRIGQGRPGVLTRRLHRAFRERVGLGDRMPWDEEPSV